MEGSRNDEANFLPDAASSSALPFSSDHPRMVAAEVEPPPDTGGIAPPADALPSSTSSSSPTSPFPVAVAPEAGGADAEVAQQTVRQTMAETFSPLSPVARSVIMGTASDYLLLRLQRLIPPDAEAHIGEGRRNLAERRGRERGHSPSDAAAGEEHYEEALTEVWAAPEHTFTFGGPAYGPLNVTGVLSSGQQNASNPTAATEVKPQDDSDNDPDLTLGGMQL